MEQLHAQSANVPVVPQNSCRPTDCHPIVCGPRRRCRPDDCRPDDCRPTLCGPNDCGPAVCGPLDCRPSDCRPNDCRPTRCAPYSCSPDIGGVPYPGPKFHESLSYPYPCLPNFRGYQLVKSAPFAWLEITPSCTLKCKHCYVASMPGLGHGRMRFEDWTRVLDQLHELGCITVQFIGGEPTIHPHFCELVEYAAQLGFEIEVYSNLAGITQRMWSLFVKHGVHLACSFYSDDAAIHDEITNTPGSFERTLANIKKNLSLGLTLRVGMIDMQDNQRIAEGKALLQSLGVSNVGIDRIRGVGRGGAIAPEDPVAALCGACANGKCAVTASGEVYPCVFARSFPVGNVLNQSMREILYDKAMVDTQAMLAKAFEERQVI